MSDSTPLRRRTSDVHAHYTQIRSEAGRDVGESRHALHGLIDDASHARRLIAELEREFEGLRRLADAKVVSPVHGAAPPSSNRPWLGVALGAVVLFSTWGLGASNRGSSAETLAAINGAEFTGTIKPSERSTLTSVAGGTVQGVLVAVGDNVAAGDPLVEMDDPSARAAMESAASDLHYATLDSEHWERSIVELDRSVHEVTTAFARSMGAVAVAQRQAEQVPGRQLRDSPERAQAAFDQEVSRLQRLRKLHVQQLVSDEQLEEQTTAVRIAQNDLENARQWRAAAEELERAQQDQARQQIARSRAEFQQMRAEYVARLGHAKARADQAQQRVDAAKRQLDASVVRAATAGVVVDVSVDVGSRPSPGAPLVTIAKLNDLLVEVPVSPKLVNILQVGGKAAVTLPTLPPQQVEGRVASINPIPAANMTHVIEVEFANASGHLLSGQRAQVVFR